VAIIQRYIPHYRAAFFEALRDVLSEQRIELAVIYDQPGDQDALKHDAVALPWGHRIHNTIIHLAGKELYWQPAWRFLDGADLVIVEQASKLLINYILILQSKLHVRKVAFWGHGKNFQRGNGWSIAEAVKRRVSTNVDWWFAYNEMSARVVESLGYPPERITIVNNAIDTHELRTSLLSQRPEELTRLRSELGIQGNHVGLYVGGMYPERRLDFLLSSCRLIHDKLPDFEMIFIGSGIEAGKVRRAAEGNSWIHFVGPKLGLERVPYFAISQVFLMPEVVGLAVLDCFALMVPLVTCHHSQHGPEIEYLEPGVNGIVVEKSDDPAAYADAVVSILSDKELHARLVQGCQGSQKKYSLDEMVRRFVEGIEGALRA